MTAEAKCPTCGRRPSDRYGSAGADDEGNIYYQYCSDPLHDKADRVLDIEQEARRKAMVEACKAVCGYCRESVKCEQRFDGTHRHESFGSWIYCKANEVRSLLSRESEGGA